MSKLAENQTKTPRELMAEFIHETENTTSKDATLYLKACQKLLTELTFQNFYKINKEVSCLNCKYVIVVQFFK